MTLAEQIKQRLTDAMRRRETVEKEILRLALGEIQSVQEREGRTLSDADAGKLLRKLVKSNEETIQATDKAEVREQLNKENQILLAFLPQALGPEQIIAALADVAEQVAAAGNDGQATGVAMKHLKSVGAVVEGRDVATAVRSLRGA